MKHPSLHEAELAVSDLAAPMSRAARRARWVEALETFGGRVFTFNSIEFTPRSMRAWLRTDRSALSIAYADPVLRAAGLRDDSYGAAREFFDLSHGEMHALLCGCIRGRSESAYRTALRVRRLGEFPLVPAGRVVARVARAITARFS